jgi:hypothetical protein
MSAPDPKIPHVALSKLFERRNKRGERYLVGRLGDARVLIVASGEVSRGEPVWRLFVGEAPYTDETVRGGVMARVED